jgi:hypothetical protein
VSFSFVQFVKAYADITHGVRTRVTVASHAIFTSVNAALFKTRAVAPDIAPLIERKKERDPAPFRAVSVVFISIQPLIFSLLSVVSARCGFGFLGVGSPPRAPARKPLLSAIFGVSHRVLSYRSVVRAGVGAETLTPSRLYHPLTEGAHR